MTNKPCKICGKIHTLDDINPEVLAKIKEQIELPESNNLTFKNYKDFKEYVDLL
jgi:hypothetical protein